MSRSGLQVAWERGFATEDEADEAYEKFEQWLEEHPFMLADRFDGNTIRVYIAKDVMEQRAREIETAFKLTTVSDRCVCGHVALTHRGEDSSCGACECPEFVHEADGGEVMDAAA